MYRSLQYVIFTSCDVVVLRRILLYCSIVTLVGTLKTV